jgi:hypothetical protein
LASTLGCSHLPARHLLLLDLGAVLRPFSHLLELLALLLCLAGTEEA